MTAPLRLASAFEHGPVACVPLKHRGPAMPNPNPLHGAVSALQARLWDFRSDVEPLQIWDLTFAYDVHSCILPACLYHGRGAAEPGVEARGFGKSKAALMTMSKV